jgi:hypothetical protein
MSIAEYTILLHHVCVRTYFLVADGIFIVLQEYCEGIRRKPTGVLHV